MAGKSTMFSRMFRETAVIWRNPVNDGYGGRTFSAPAEIRCRWNEAEVLRMGPNNEQYVANVVVYTDAAVEIGDFLWYGTLATLTNTDPMLVNEAWVVRDSEVDDNMNQSISYNKVYLGRQARSEGM